MNFRPAPEKIVVKRDDPKSKTPGGIMLPDEAQKIPQTGEVIAVGDSIVTGSDEENLFFRNPEPCKERDRIVFDTLAAREVELDGQKFLIIGFDDVLSVIES